ncbi:MAG: hypothetical protein ABSF81_10060 [Bacteroidales bacterium]|jgi:hypothetical protein
MTKKLILFALLLIAGINVCNASKIDGKWKTTMNGGMELTFTFKVVGDTVLTGTVSGQMGEMPILNGKIKGNEFSFDVSMGETLMPHKCKLEGDVIKMKVDLPAGMGGNDNAPTEMILKKVE